MSETWSIIVAQEKLTLKDTTQSPKHLAVMPLSCRYRADRMFGVKQFDCIRDTYMMHAKEQVGPRTELKANVRKYGINGHSSERERSN